MTSTPIPDLALNMVRHNLAGIPRHPLPTTHTLRWFEPGDDLTWTRIERCAENRVPIASGLHAGQFGTDLDALRLRQCFLCDRAGKAVGTASAWFENNYRGGPWGRVHWVALIPEARGRGLAKPLLAAILRRLRQCGHTRAMLSTHSYRREAISLYLKFGFVPDPQSDSEAAVWQAVRTACR